MAGRTLLPVIVLGTLGVATASLGIGYGLGQYTISGMDPFTATTRWQADVPKPSFEERSRTARQFAAVFDPPVRSD